MQHSRFTEQQIAFVLEQVARGASIEDTCRKADISPQTYFRWRAKYAGLKPAEIRRLHQIEEENKRLKRLLAALLVVKSTPSGPALAPEPAPLRSGLPVPIAPTTGGGNRYGQALSGYLAKLPSRPGLDVRPQVQTALRYAQAWIRTSIRARGAQLRGRPLADLGTQLWAWMRKTWRARKVLALCFAGGLIGGFAMGLAPTAHDDVGNQPLPVNMSVRADSFGDLTSTMDKGWSRPQAWGRWMTAGTASMMLGFDAPSRGDVELLIEARARIAKGQPEQTVIVRFNDAELGRWRVPEEARNLRRRFIVPAAVFNKSTVAQLTFAFAERAPLSPVFGLEVVSLRDARLLHDYLGFVDSCKDGKLTGWAVAQGTGVSVAASIDGTPVAAAFVSKMRPDLAGHGLPKDAGYELTLAEPVPAGTAIDVRFANGRPLRGSPCKL